MHPIEFFPDGVTVIDDWFYEEKIPTLSDYEHRYMITDYGIYSDNRIWTTELQALIDRIHISGGGVMIVPEGTFYTASLFFKQGVHLYIEKNGVLKGSDDISDYPLMETRIEGETCTYFPALINADHADGFTMFGEGTIDGNGKRFWKAFWLRRKWNPQCTNKDEQRPRLVYISNSSNVTVAGLKLHNSAFWTDHLYKCDHVRYLNCHIYSPAGPVHAPSTDALDIDVCTDVHVKNCYMEVNDDSVVLKGGKGPWADTAPENGANERILVEDCEFGFCHGTLTCGSESIHNKNILIRNLKLHRGFNMLWLKMRPDTPQHYEYITMENVEGSVANFININPWTQFYDLKDRKEIPLSYADHVTIKNCNVSCGVFFNVKTDPKQYQLTDFALENLNITADMDGFDKNAIERLMVKNVNVSIREVAEGFAGAGTSGPV